MTDEEIIANEKYHTCGRCKWDALPEDCCPCSQCIHGPDNREDFWQYAESEVQESEWEHDHEILKAYSDGASDILDKIIEEINEYKSRQLTLAIGVDDLEKGKQIAIEYVLGILDKYKAESEVQE